jgi:hypothetical protein
VEFLVSRRQKVGYVVLAVAFAIVIVAVSLRGPIAQDLAYHLFTDDRNYFSIPNFWNVISNVAFLVVGAIGIHGVLWEPRFTYVAENRPGYLLLFLGASLVSVGSGYYHLWPDNDSLVWDRLPMTIAFMALLSVVVSEFISIRVGKWLLWPLQVLGIFSVFYWYISEQDGQGDLRYYALVQFIPMLSIPLILIFFRCAYTRASGYGWLLGAYGLAKLFEHYDEAIYQSLGFISGHSLKHITAAVGLYLLIVSYQYRLLRD